jgi:hypothetical protein
MGTSCQFGCKGVSLLLVLSLIVSSVVIMASTAAAETGYQPPIGYVDGNQTMQNLGRSVVLMDLNLDGVSDLVVGAPYTTAGGLTESGSVTIYMSNAGVPMSRVLVMNGNHAGELFGWTVTNIGDVNGDGSEDLAIGVPWADPAGLDDAGNITLMYSWVGFDGAANATITGLNAGEELGFSIAAAGDVNGDGMDDLIAGAPYYSSGTLPRCGRAYVFYGGNPPNSVPDKTYTGEVAEANLGWSVSGGGSVDADADLDMIAGAPGQGTAGAAYLVRDLIKANPTVSVISGKSADENFSFSVLMIPDIDGDTITDLAIGAPTNNDNGDHAGAVYLLFGGSKFNTVTDLKIVGEENEWLGWSVATGDFHEDGVSDLLVGAPNSNINASSPGRGYAYYGGASLSSTPNLTLVPDTGASFFGASLAVGPNMTGDMAPDFAVGDPLFSVAGAPNAGRVYVYSGLHVIIPTNPVVKGHVYVPGTAQGIGGFTVTLESPLLQKSTVANAAGYFTFTAIPGTFWLNASMPGYVTNSTNVTLAMNDDITVPSFYPLKTPVAMGVVKDGPTGALLQGASVALFDGPEFVQKMTTGANGTYWFYLPADLVPPEGSSTTVTILAWDATRYTSTASVSLSRNQTAWQNFTLDRFPVVAGSVREALGLSAVRNALVQASQGDEIVASTTTDIRGLYSLVATNATAGLLYVNVTAAGYFRTTLSVAVNKNGSYSLNFLLQRDNAPPTSQLSTLGEYTTTPLISLSATAFDLNGVQEVQLWYKAEASGSYEMYSSDSETPYEFSFDPSSAGGDGVYSFFSIAVDYAGNREAAPAGNDTWTFADSHGPTLAVTQPSPNHLYGTSSVLAQWMGSDSGSGIAKFEARLDTLEWVDVGLLPLHLFTAVPDGPHNVTINATDRAGLKTVVTVSFEVDTAGPISYVVNNLQYIANETFTVAVLANDVNGIEEVQLWYRYGGAGDYAYLGADEESPYNFEVNSSLLEGDGAYEFYSLAIDGAGNNETPPPQSDFSTIVDTTPPGVSIDHPATGSAVGDDTVSINWTSSDAASGIQSSETRIDGGSWAPRYTATSCVYDSLSEGNHTVEVRVVDNVGHTATVSTTFQVDTYAPIVSIISPENEAAFSGYQVDLYWSASDNGSGIASLTVSKDGSNWEQVELTDTTYSFAGTLMNVDGTYRLYVRAVDAGGLSTIASVDVMMDRMPPMVYISHPYSGEKIGRTNATLKWIASDEVSGVGSIRISVDGGPYVSVGSASSWELTDLAEGQHNVTVRISDNAGNSREVSVTFTVAPSGGISTLTIAGIAVVIIVVVIASALMLRRRKPGEPQTSQADGKR